MTEPEAAPEASMVKVVLREKCSSRHMLCWSVSCAGCGDLLDDHVYADGLRLMIIRLIRQHSCAAAERPIAQGATPTLPAQTAPMHTWASEESSFEGSA